MWSERLKFMSLVMVTRRLRSGLTLSAISPQQPTSSSLSMYFVKAISHIVEVSDAESSNMR